MKTYKEFITEVLTPDERTRDRLSGIRTEKKRKEIELQKEIEARRRKEETERKYKKENYISKSKDELLKWLERNKDDPRCRSALKLFQNGQTPTSRQLQGIEQMMRNRRKDRPDNPTPKIEQEIKKIEQEKREEIKKLESEYTKTEVRDNLKMNRLNYEKRPVFSGTERIRKHYERREWVQDNLLPEGQDIIRYIQSNIWMSEHENGGIGLIEINSKTTTPDILKVVKDDLIGKYEMRKERVKRGR
jgi:hypothetical protein